MNAASVIELQAHTIVECADDFVGLWVFVRMERSAYPTRSDEAIREGVLHRVGALLAEGLITAGYPAANTSAAGQPATEHIVSGPASPSFRAMGMSPGQILDLMRTQWPRDRDPDIGEILWFTATTLGERIAKALLASSG